MSKTRMFVALDVSLQVRQRAMELVKLWQVSGVKIHWVAPENLHLTLKFLGDQTDEEMTTICQAVQRAVVTLPEFEFTCHGAGAFPNLQRPRTLWIGVRDGAEQVLHVQQCVDRALAQLGFPTERRGFVPHLTIGRVRSGGAALAVLGQMVSKEEDLAVGVTTVDEVVVYGSFRQRGGPIYEVLARAPLGT